MELTITAVGHAQYRVSRERPCKRMVAVPPTATIAQLLLLVLALLFLLFVLFIFSSDRSGSGIDFQVDLLAVLRCLGVEVVALAVYIRNVLESSRFDLGFDLIRRELIVCGTRLPRECKQQSCASQC